MTEPTGHRIDGTPWEEARPPHLPDAVVRLSPWTFAFLAVTLLHVGLAFQAATRLGPQAGSATILQILDAYRTPLIVSLFGVALFLRHPDARRSHPLLVVGVALFSLSTLLDVAGGPVVRFLSELDPAGVGAYPIPPGVTAWSMFTTLVSVAAVLYTAAGLSTARRRPPIRAAGVMAISLSIVAVAATILSLAGLQWADVAASPYAAIALVIGVALGLASTLAWSYLLVVSLGGWLGGETPRPGWAAAALAASLFVAIRVVIALPLGLAATSGGGAVIAALGIASTLSWLALLAAFALGLPATADRPAGTPRGSAGS